MSWIQNLPPQRQIRGAFRAQGAASGCSSSQPSPVLSDVASDWGRGQKTQFFLSWLIPALPVFSGRVLALGATDLCRLSSRSQTEGHTAPWPHAANIRLSRLRSSRVQTPRPSGPGPSRVHRPGPLEDVPELQPCSQSGGHISISSLVTRSSDFP